MFSSLVQYSSSDDSEDDSRPCRPSRPTKASKTPKTTSEMARSIVDELVTAALMKAQEPIYHHRGGGVDIKIESDDDDSSSSDSSSSLLTSASDAGDSDSDTPQTRDNPVRRKQTLKTKGEIDLFDLPPIEDLTISVPESACVSIGSVESIVDNLVVVKSLPNSPALDLDSVFFLDQGKRALGKIFDVFGPVTQPYYSVRFNSAEHIQSKEIVKGHQVYCAPKTQHTSFIFLEQLRRLKGTDASWKNDEETPEHLREYSDDEEERKAKREAKLGKRASADQASGVKPENSAFFRKQKKYNPRDFGQIQWNSVHTQHLPQNYSGSNVIRPSVFPPGGNQLQNPFAYPPPPMQSPMPSTSSYNPHSSHQFGQPNFPPHFRQPPPSVYSSYSQDQIPFSSFMQRPPPPPPNQ